MRSILLLALVWSSTMGFIGQDKAEVVVKESWRTELRVEDDLDSVAIYQSEKHNWAIVTSKAADYLAVYDAETGKEIRNVGKTGTGPVEFERPNGILVIDDLLMVVERDNHRVQVLSLPDFTHIGFLGETTLKRPYGLTGFTEHDGTTRIYVTDDYKPVPETATPPAGFYKDRIRVFRFSAGNNSIDLKQQYTFGVAEGDGVLYKVESILADVPNNRLFISDERGADPGIKVYDLDGRFTGERLDTSNFSGEAEGIGLMENGEGGYLVGTDQQKTVSWFHIYDRKTLKHLGRFRGERTTNTDGIAVFGQSVGAMSMGGLWAIHDDSALSAFDWSKVVEAMKF